MKPILTLINCLFFSLSVAFAEQPNIVVILSDDQGYADYSFMGHDMIETPAIDKLAAESLVYKRGYVTAALCSPSLGTMITGTYPHINRTTGNDPFQGTPRTTWNDHFAKAPQLPKLLATKGYLSLHTGKYWHGHPKVSGFTDSMGGTGRHGSDYSLSIGRETMKPVYDFIQKAQDQSKPFMVWYAPFLPHTPHNPPKDLEDKYAAMGAKHQSKYYAMCEWFDQTCGQLLDHLDKKGLSDNTIIFYICDNGWGNMEGRRGSVKVSPYELGVRTPIMIKWPGKIAAKMNNENLACNIDLVPTLLAAAGVEIPKELPGLDLLNYDEVNKRKHLFLANHTHDLLDADRPSAGLRARSIVTKDWKLNLWRDTHPRLEDEKWQMPQPEVKTELFHIAKDPLEGTNLAAEQPERVKEMQKLLDAWWNPIPHSPMDGDLPIKHFVYRSVDGTELNIKLTYPPNWKPGGKKLPAAVFFFGGGWHTGNIAQFNGIAPYLAKRGMIVATPEYRTIQTHNILPDTCLADSKSAMRYIIENADYLGIDTTKIAAGGRSAGGHLAAANAYCKSSHNTEGDDTSIDTTPAALLLINPVIDNGPGGFSHGLVKAYWKTFSPMHNISNTPVPTLFLTGDKDQYTPIETAKKYQKLTQDNGGRCELVIFKDGVHGSPMVGNKNFQRSLQEMDQFLVSLGFIEAGTNNK